MSIDKHLEPRTRQLAAALEPVAAQVYFAPSATRPTRSWASRPARACWTTGCNYPTARPTSPVEAR